MLDENRQADDCLSADLTDSRANKKLTAERDQTKSYTQEFRLDEFMITSFLSLDQTSIATT